jgi:hypothetical protein
MSQSFYPSTYAESTETLRTNAASSLQGPGGWKMNGEPTVLVNQPSATGGSRSWEATPNHIHAIKRNHSEMVKFYPRDPCYTIIRHVLKDLVEETPLVSQSPTAGA